MKAWDRMAEHEALEALKASRNIFFLTIFRQHFPKV